MQLTVARIGRAHGLRGEVALDVRTDTPEDRFGVGAVLATEPAAPPARSRSSGTPRPSRTAGS